jgi:hypothetical protein
MKYFTPLVAILFILSLQAVAQQENRSWEKYRFLIGDWVGEGSGAPGEGSGYFSFAMELEKNILVRKNHSEYPAAQSRPATIHDDLLIVYRERPDSAEKAIYFDNEDHVIHYVVAHPAAGEIVFTSERKEGMPFFRLTYSNLAEGYVNLLFEISQDGSHYRKYLEGHARRKM